MLNWFTEFALTVVICDTSLSSRRYLSVRAGGDIDHTGDVGAGEREAWTAATVPTEAALHDAAVGAPGAYAVEPS